MKVALQWKFSIKEKNQFTIDDKHDIINSSIIVSSKTNKKGRTLLLPFYQATKLIGNLIEAQVSNRNDRPGQSSNFYLIGTATVRWCGIGRVVGEVRYFRKREGEILLFFMFKSCLHCIKNVI